MKGVLGGTRRLCRTLRTGHRAFGGDDGASGGVSWTAGALCVVVLGLSACAEAQEIPLPDRAPEPAAPSLDVPVVDVRIEGNTTIPADAIARYIKTRPGRPPSQAQIREDVKALYATRWFFSVEPRYRAVDDGVMIIFRVLERPVVQNVEYRGNKKVKTKYLAARTGLKKGSPFDVSANRESVRRLEEYYHEKGFAFAKIDLAKGGDKDDREVIFDIDEGSKVRVTWISFTGNTLTSDAVLRTKIRTKPAIAWLMGGLYDPATIPDDITAIRQYYHNLGYFDVEIDDDVTFNKSRSHATFKYTIREGERYRIRNIVFLGNNIFDADELKQEMELAEGDHFNMRHLTKDVAKVKRRYGETGRLFATVDAIPRFLEQSGEADIVYRIDEDKVYRVRRVDVVINGQNSHTKRSAVLNRSLIFPGDLADPRQIERTKRRVGGSGLFERGPQNGVTADIRRVVKEDAPARNGVLRGQSVDWKSTGWGHSTIDARGRIDSLPAGRPFRQEPPREPDSVSPVLPPAGFPAPLTMPAPPARPSEQPASQKPALSSPAKLEFRGQSFDEPGPLERPGMPFFGQSPQGDPLYNPLYEPLTEEEVDIIFHATEARTGRLMFGAGVTSDAGVVATIVLSEQNFDILRPPTSLRDIVNGTAWRGDGQRFRAEAVPGNVVSRYLVSWSDPYFLDTDYSFGLSGFYYNRYFPDWNEDRKGGRVTLGRQFTPRISLAGELRLEDVTLYDPDQPTPPLLAAAVGNSFLSTIRITGTHDTRDSAFLPGEGHKIDLSYEQAFGDFNYPRAELDASQYFTVYRRADGGGRHVVSLNGRLGWTDSNTPIFERFFAGGVQTFRGFEYRGIGPRQFGVALGGRWMAIGSVEYMFPLTANEQIQLVVFSDFGTVEEDVGFDEFRATVGAGLRVTMPSMGPVPLAFDWTLPLVREDSDETRIFSFYVGLVR